MSWENVSAWDYVSQSASSNAGDFLGGYEINGATRTDFDKDWNVTSESVDTSSIVFVALTSAEISLLPSSFSEVTDVTYKYYNEDLKGTVVTSDSW